MTRRVRFRSKATGEGSRTALPVVAAFLTRIQDTLPDRRFPGSTGLGPRLWRRGPGQPLRGRPRRPPRPTSTATPTRTATAKTLSTRHRLASPRWSALKKRLARTFAPLCLPNGRLLRLLKCLPQNRSHHPTQTPARCLQPRPPLRRAEATVELAMGRCRSGCKEGGMDCCQPGQRRLLCPR